MDLKLAFALLLQIKISRTSFYKDYSGVLMEEYVLKCGFENFCNTSKLSMKTFVSRSYANYSLCPECSCQSSCIGKDECCPDVYLKYPQNCREVEILDPIDKPRYYALVDQCPHNADATLIEKCENRTAIIDRLVNPPVTSNDVYPYIFFNEYCALCNDVTDFKEWTLELKCPGFADFNFVSSNEELVQTAKENNCLLRYTPHTDRGVQKCQKFENPRYEYCPDNYQNNVIRRACESQYIHRHFYFKNIFCEICNTPELNEDTSIKPEMTSTSHDKLVIANCNVTGLWEDYDEEVEASCRMYRRTTAMYIYKNVFCYICNTNYAYASSNKFLDINGLITRAEYNPGRSYLIYGKIHLGFNSFKEDNIISSLENASGISTTIEQ